MDWSSRFASSCALPVSDELPTVRWGKMMMPAKTTPVLRIIWSHRTNHPTRLNYAIGITTTTLLGLPLQSSSFNAHGERISLGQFQRFHVRNRGRGFRRRKICLDSVVLLRPGLGRRKPSKCAPTAVVVLISNAVLVQTSLHGP